MKKEVSEGSVRITVDSADIVSKDLEVFYNPKMQLNRSLSIHILKESKKDDLQIGLPLAGTGIRGLRFLSELPANKIKFLALNDHNSKAKDYFFNNAKANNLAVENTEFYTKDANQFLNESKGFDYIDIDPYGSPNFLLDSAIARIARNGILAVTATDTGTLAGTYPQTCKFKYWSESALCPQKHEMGLRILVRKVQLLGLHNEKALIPFLCYHHEHYYRIFFKAHKGKKKASKLFDSLNSYFHYCVNCGNSFLSDHKEQDCSECSSSKLVVNGPLYDGPLQDNEYVYNLANQVEDKKIHSLLLNLAQDNTIETVGSFDTHSICKQHGFHVEKRETYIQRLKNKGFQASKSMFPVTGIKTNAPFKDVLKVFFKEESKK